MAVGYVTDNTEFVRGLSPMHDSGTGASSGASWCIERESLLISALQAHMVTSRSCLSSAQEASAHARQGWTTGSSIVRTTLTCVPFTVLLFNRV